MHTGLDNDVSYYLIEDVLVGEASVGCHLFDIIDTTIRKTVNIFIPT
jgi:hypothetical protein